MSERYASDPPLEGDGPAPGDGAGTGDQTREAVGEANDAPAREERKGPLAGALAWAEQGFSVFPCGNGGERHKRPLVKGGFKSATTDRAQIEAWWRKFPHALIGMPTGDITGIGVLDLDKKGSKDGYAAVPDWESLSPAIARTGSGGAHLYFRADEALRSTTGANGVDVRGNGGYAIVPPSAGYTWLKTGDLAALPPFPLGLRPSTHEAAPADELEAEDPAMIEAALRVIPNHDEDYDSWARIGMAVWRATGGSDDGLDAWDRWSEKSGKYSAHTTAERWEGFGRSPPHSIGAGTIFWLADEADPDWRFRYYDEVEAQAQTLLNAAADAFSADFGLGSPRIVENEDLGCPEVEPAAATEPCSPSIEKPPLGLTQPAEETELPAARLPVKPVSALGEWNAGDDDWAIPARQWLLGNVFCRTFVSSLIADGGIGKTALRVLQALALATGKNLTGEHVFERCRVLLISLEDDRNELRRRVRAAMLHHGISPEEVDGWLFLSSPEGKAGKLVTSNPRTRRPMMAEMKAEIEKAIIAHKIDVLILDPLVKAHDVEENDNSAMDVVIQTLSNLAVAHNIAVDALHHTSKGAADPGNADRGRGASAVKNGARLVYTLTQMSADEARQFGIDEGRRRSFVRVDSGKVNITPPLASAKWFQLIGVPLGNADRLYPNGDNVQTMAPWTPPAVWDGISDDVLRRILDDIEAGVPGDPERGLFEGSRYSSSPRVKVRAAWELVARHSPDKNEKQCRDFIAELVKKKQLVVKDYKDPNDRKTVKGLFVAKPGDFENDPM